MASKWELGRFTQAQLLSVELAAWGANARRYRASLRDGGQVWLHRMSDVIDELNGGDIAKWSADRICEAADLNPEAPISWLAWAPTRARDEAADVGTELHTHIQAYLERGEWPTVVSEPVALLLQSWALWWGGSGLIVEQCEKPLADLELGIGGTADLIARGALVDWKSSNKLRDLHRLQVIGYAGIHSRMTHGVVPVPQMIFPERCLLVHVHRDGSPATALDLYHTQDEARELYFVFLNLLFIHQWRRGLRNEAQRHDRALKREQRANADTTFCE